MFKKRRDKRRVAPSLGRIASSKQELKRGSAESKASFEHHAAAAELPSEKQNIPRNKTESELIDRLCAGALGRQAQELQESLPPDARKIEVIIFSSFLPFAALGVAQKSHKLLQVYTEEIAACLSIVEPGADDLLRLRLSGYSASYGQDIQSGQPEMAPKLIERALQNILGKSDHTVVTERMTLLIHFMASLKVDVDFIKKIPV